ANTNRRTTSRKSRRSSAEGGTSPFERRLPAAFRRHVSQRHRTTRSAARKLAKRARAISFPVESRYRSLPESELPCSTRHRSAEQPALDESRLHFNSSSRPFRAERSV